MEAACSELHRLFITWGAELDGNDEDKCWLTGGRGTLNPNRPFPIRVQEEAFRLRPSGPQTTKQT